MACETSREGDVGVGGKEGELFPTPKEKYETSVSSALSTCHTPNAKDGNIAYQASRKDSVEQFGPKPCTSLIIYLARILQQVVLLTASDLRALS